MNGSILEVNKYKVVILDDFYDRYEYDSILQECLFLSKREKLLPPSETFSAKKDGEYLKSNSGVFLDDVYANKNFSDILFHNKKIFHPVVQQELEKVDIFYRFLNFKNRYNTLLSYYEDGDFYKSHKDNAVITTITWLYKNPKSFVGGNIFFEEDKNKVVECKNNRTIFFPSFLNHEVDEIKMEKDKIGLGLGRFTLTQFVFI